MELREQACEACRADAPRVTTEERARLMGHLPDWQVEEVEGVEQLVRLFRFADFQQALEFTQRVGALAEEQNHHPALLTEWGRVTVRWWTHKIKGLHKNDFICAARTDLLLAGE
mgnify:FL=1